MITHLDMEAATLAPQPSPLASQLVNPMTQPHQPVLRLRLIGQMAVTVTATSESVLPTGRKTRALLAVVAMAAPRPALRGRLAELLWSRRPEEQARASLRQEIHRLLEVLSVLDTEILQVTRDHISIRPGAVWVDVEEVMRATLKQPAPLALLEGDLLEDLDGADPAFDAWLAGERERLRDRGRSLAEQVLQSQDDPELTISAAQRLLGIDRAHEGAWRSLMRAYAARGERGMAIQSYDRCRAVLADMLDAAPSPETQTLLAEIRGPSSSRTPLRPVSLAPPAHRVVLPPFRLDRVESLESVSRAIPEDDSRRSVQIGVLPFHRVSGEAEDAHLSTALAEDITTALSRFRSLSVVASNALARFAETSRDEDAIRRCFGLDFLLDGSIQRVRNRVRVTARLLDLRAGNQVAWARRFDRGADDLMAVQDETAAEIVGQVDAEIHTIESRRVAARPPVETSPYDLVMRAIALMNRMEHAPFMRAGEMLRRATELDPDYASGYAWAAWWHGFLVAQGWADAPAEASAEADRLVERAAQLDGSDARTLAIAGYIGAFLHHRLHEGAALQDRALALNPNLPMAWALSALSHAWMGNTQEAERRIGRYKLLSPHDPLAFLFDGFSTTIHLLKREFEPAVAAGRTVTQMNPLLAAGFKPYLAALGHLGRRQEAAIALRRLLAIEPDFSVQSFLAITPLEREPHREIFVQGLRKAGVPDLARSDGTVPLRA